MRVGCIGNPLICRESKKEIQGQNHWSQTKCRGAAIFTICWSALALDFILAFPSQQWDSKAAQYYSLLLLYSKRDVQGLEGLIAPSSMQLLIIGIVYDLLTINNLQASYAFTYTAHNVSNAFGVLQGLIKSA